MKRIVTLLLVVLMVGAPLLSFSTAPDFEITPQLKSELSKVTIGEMYSYSIENIKQGTKEVSLSKVKNVEYNLSEIKELNSDIVSKIIENDDQGVSIFLKEVDDEPKDTEISESDTESEVTSTEISEDSDLISLKVVTKEIVEEGNYTFSATIGGKKLKELVVKSEEEGESKLPTLEDSLKELPKDKKTDSKKEKVEKSNKEKNEEPVNKMLDENEWEEEKNNNNVQTSTEVADYKINVSKRFKASTTVDYTNITNKKLSMTFYPAYIGAAMILNGELEGSDYSANFNAKPGMELFWENAKIYHKKDGTAVRVSADYKSPNTGELFKVDLVTSFPNPENQGLTREAVYVTNLNKEPTKIGMIIPQQLKKEKDFKYVPGAGVTFRSKDDSDFVVTTLPGNMANYTTMFWKTTNQNPPDQEKFNYYETKSVDAEGIENPEVAEKLFEKWKVPYKPNEWAGNSGLWDSISSVQQSFKDNTRSDTLPGDTEYFYIDKYIGEVTVPELELTSKDELTLPIKSTTETITGTVKAPDWATGDLASNKATVHLQDLSGKKVTSVEVNLNKGEKSPFELTFNTGEFTDKYGAGVHTFTVVAENEHGVMSMPKKIKITIPLKEVKTKLKVLRGDKEVTKDEVLYYGEKLSFNIESSWTAHYDGDEKIRLTILDNLLTMVEGSMTVNNEAISDASFESGHWQHRLSDGEKKDRKISLNFEGVITKDKAKKILELEYDLITDTGTGMHTADFSLDEAPPRFEINLKHPESEYFYYDQLEMAYDYGSNQEIIDAIVKKAGLSIVDLETNNSQGITIHATKDSLFDKLMALKPGKTMDFTLVGKKRGYVSEEVTIKIIYKEKGIIPPPPVSLPLSGIFEVPSGANSTVHEDGKQAVITEDETGQKGAIFSTDEYKIDLTKDFKAKMYLYLGDKERSAADGMTFVVHNDESNIKEFHNKIGETLGVWALPGDHIGNYALKNMKNSWAVEFDTFHNHDGLDASIGGNYNRGHLAWSYPNETSGYNHKGSWVSSLIHHDLQEINNDRFNGNNSLSNGSWHPLSVSWTTTDTGVGYFTYQLDDFEPVKTEEMSVDKIFKSPNVYWGFTGSTGGNSEDARAVFVSVPGTMDVTHELSVLKDDKKIDGEDKVTPGDELTIKTNVDYHSGKVDIKDGSATLAIDNKLTYQKGTFKVNGKAQPDPEIVNNQLVYNFESLSNKNKELEISIGVSVEHQIDDTTSLVSSQINSETYIDEIKKVVNIKGIPPEMKISAKQNVYPVNEKEVESFQGMTNERLKLQLIQLFGINGIDEAIDSSEGIEYVIEDSTVYDDIRNIKKDERVSFDIYAKKEKYHSDTLTLEINMVSGKVTVSYLMKNSDGTVTKLAADDTFVDDDGVTMTVVPKDIPDYKVVGIDPEDGNVTFKYGEDVRAKVFYDGFLTFKALESLDFGTIKVGDKDYKKPDAIHGELKVSDTRTVKNWELQVRVKKELGNEKYKNVAFLYYNSEILGTHTQLGVELLTVEENRNNDKVVDILGKWNDQKGLFIRTNDNQGKSGDYQGELEWVLSDAP